MTASPLQGGGGETHSGLSLTRDVSAQAGQRKAQDRSVSPSRACRKNIAPISQTHCDCSEAIPPGLVGGKCGSAALLCLSVGTGATASPERVVRGGSAPSLPCLSKMQMYQYLLVGGGFT